MNTLTIQLEDHVFHKLAAFASRQGKSAEEIVASVTAEELREVEAMERLEAAQREAKSRLNKERVHAAFEEIRALNATPLRGDAMPDQ